MSKLMLVALFLIVGTMVANADPSHRCNPHNALTCPTKYVGNNGQ